MKEPLQTKRDQAGEDGIDHNDAYGGLDFLTHLVAALSRKETRFLARPHEQRGLAAGRCLTPMDHVRRDAAPFFTVEPVPLVAAIALVDPEFRLDNIAVIATILEAEPLLRFRGKLGIAIPG